MITELQQLEYFISLLIEGDNSLDLSNAEDDRVQAYHAHKISMETLKQLAKQRDDLLAACKAVVKPVDPGEDCGLPTDTYNAVCKAIVKAEGKL